MEKNLFLSYIIQDAYQNLSKRDVEKNVNNIIHENVSLQYSIPILPTKRDIATCEDESSSLRTIESDARISFPL